MSGPEADITPLGTENRTIFFGEGCATGLDPERRRLLSDWLRSMSVRTVLDVGCLRGDFLQIVADPCERWGIDLERHPELDEGVRFVQADAGDPWPVPSSHFDLVFAGEIIEHVFDTRCFLRQCFRVLKPGAWLLMTTPNLSSFANLRAWLSADQPMWVDSECGQNGHVRYVSPRRLRGMLCEEGYCDVTLASVAGLESLKRVGAVYRLAHRLFPLRGNRLCAKARKPDPKPYGPAGDGGPEGSTP